MKSKFEMQRKPQYFPGKVIPLDKPPKINRLSRKDCKKWMAMPNPLLKILEDQK